MEEVSKLYPVGSPSIFFETAPVHAALDGSQLHLLADIDPCIVTPTDVQHPTPPVRPLSQDEFPGRLPSIATLTVPPSSMPAPHNFEEELDQLDSSYSGDKTHSQNEEASKKPMKMLGTYLNKFMETARQAEVSFSSTPSASQKNDPRKKIQLHGSQTKRPVPRRDDSQLRLLATPSSRTLKPRSGRPRRSFAEHLGHTETQPASTKPEPGALLRAVSTLRVRDTSGNLPIGQ